MTTQVSYSQTYFGDHLFLTLKPALVTMFHQPIVQQDNLLYLHSVVSTTLWQPSNYLSLPLGSL